MNRFSFLTFVLFLSLGCAQESSPPGEGGLPNSSNDDLPVDQVGQIGHDPDGVVSSGDCGDGVCDPNDPNNTGDPNDPNNTGDPNDPNNTGDPNDPNNTGEPEMACGYDTGIRVFILLDKSESMAPGWIPHPTIPNASVYQDDKWAQARTAVQSFMSSQAAQHIEFGLGVFPTDDECGTSGQVVYPASQATADNVDDYFASHEPAGMTPLWSTLDQLRSNISSARLNDRENYHNYILLITDGQDTCYDQREDCNWFGFDCETYSYPIEPQRLVEVTTRLRDEEVRTYVIGFGSLVDEVELDAVAEAGGTELGSWLPVSNVDDLSDAFQTILDEMLECHPI